MRPKQLNWLLPISAALLFLVSLVPAQESKPLRVVTSLPLLADMAREIGGYHVQVEAMVLPGVDLHSYEPSPADVQQMREADMIVVNGLGLEGWLEKAIRNSGFQGRVVVASKGIKPFEDDNHIHEGMQQHDHDHAIDPHAWMDVSNGIVYAQNIGKALRQVDPKHADDYQSWEDLYTTQLSVLDAWIKREVSPVPRDQRVLVTDHDSMRYFGEAYGFDTNALAGVSSLSETSAHDFTEVVQLVREKNVPVVFVESPSNQKIAGQLADEVPTVRARRIYLDTAATDDAPFTYEGIFTTNVPIMMNALGGRQ